MCESITRPEMPPKEGVSKVVDRGDQEWQETIRENLDL